jgi:peptidoglycan/LPS O-acetylase OafA/YrhL
MEIKATTQKIVAIDMLRALAALGVFYYHNHVGSIIAKFSGLAFFNVTDAFGAIYAVPLFFLISGYCIHASNIKYVKLNTPLPLKEYYRRRFLRIYPAYFFALLFALAVNYLILPHYKPNNYDLLIHFFSLQGFTVAYFNTINIVLWTISIELAFYVIYPLFYYVRIKHNLNYALAFTFVVSCLSITYFQIKGAISLPQHFFVFNLWFAWCCGAFLADKRMLTALDLKKPGYLFSYFIILIACIYLNSTPNNPAILTDQFNILFWTAPMLFILSKENWLRGKQNLWLVKIIAAIGLSSYSLYLLHEPLIYFKNYLAHSYLPVRFQPAGVIAGIFIIPVVAWFNYLYIEKPFISKKRVLSVNPSIKNAG